MDASHAPQTDASRASTLANAQTPERTSDEVVKIISDLHPFQELEPEYIQKIVALSRFVACPRGKILFNRDKRSQWVYYLLDGEISLIDSTFNSRSIVSSSQQAQFPLNSTNPSNASAVVKSASQLLCIERSGLEAVMVWSETDTDSVVLPSKPDVPPVSEDEAFKNYFLDTSYSSDAPPKPEQAPETSEYQGSDWMSALLESPLFTTIPAANIQKLFGLFESQSVSAGQEVISVGEEGEYFYVIAEGRAQVELGHRKTIPLAAGEYFGEEALVGDTTRNATVRMLTKGLVMRLAKKYFVSLLQEPLFRRVELDDVPLLSDNVQMVDVRLPVEFRFARVPDSVNIPLSSVRQSLKTLDLNTFYVITDDGGARSRVAVQLFLQAGFSSALLQEAHIYY